MADSVYRVTELVGTSSTSWEAAAKSAVETASKSLRDLRVAEVVRQDLTIENGKVTTYRIRLNVSFKIRRCRHHEPQNDKSAPLETASVAGAAGLCPAAPLFLIAPSVAGRNYFANTIPRRMSHEKEPSGGLMRWLHHSPLTILP